jgi:hypothetical protein
MKPNLFGTIVLVVICFIGFLVVVSFVKALTVGLVLGLIFGLLLVAIRWLLLSPSGASEYHLFDGKMWKLLALAVAFYILFRVLDLPIVSSLSVLSFLATFIITFVVYTVGDAVLFAINKIR